jgi:Papain family cysteine protease
VAIEHGFVDQLGKEFELRDAERRVLSGAGVRDFMSLYDLTRNFPSVADLGVRLNDLSAFALRSMPRGVRAAIAAGVGSAPKRPQTSGGVRAPAGAVGAPGYTVPPATGAGILTGAAPTSTGSAGLIDVRPSAWPVRDQGKRATCVAFATVACMEIHLANASKSGVDQLSEQFVFWAAKTGTSDPRPMDDGSELQFASEGLKAHGSCREQFWPYDKTVVSGNVTHEVNGHSPSQPAKSDGQTRLIPGKVAKPSTGAAAMVCVELQQGNPVAISVPMFADRSGRYANNWSTDGAWEYGSILNPPELAAATPFGHAVCVVGFAPDPREPSGGYFVIRNSWGQNWGAQLPLAGLYGPDRGYGQLSATYVEKYLWEMLVL